MNTDNKLSKKIITILLVGAVLIIGGFLVLSGKGPDAKGTIPDEVAETKGLKIEILREGTGDEATADDTVTINYTGFLEDGTEFGNGSNFTFAVSGGEVIKAWQLGTLGMKAGELRRVTSEPELAYGEGGVRGIVPPNATVIFEIELVEIAKASSKP